MAKPQDHEATMDEKMITLNYTLQALSTIFYDATIAELEKWEQDVRRHLGNRGLSRPEEKTPEETRDAVRRRFDEIYSGIFMEPLINPHDEWDPQAIARGKDTSEA